MSKIQALTGNYSASYGAALCKPDVIAAYPITPQSSVVEKLAQFSADGEISASMVEVESEHSAMSVVQGAVMAGGRAFTATSAQGLALMYEPYFRMSTLRLPMVMALATREMTSPETVWSGQQDAVSVRDAGWMQVFVENNQEILDMIIQGYKIAEDPNILLPLNVCYDGFYLSHLSERVEIPEQAEVDAFLPPYKSRHAILDPKEPMAVDPLTPGNILIEYRKSHLEAMQEALTKIEEVNKEFADQFGRNYGGAIDTYCMDDAEIAILTIGSMTGTGREAVDEARKKGIKVGLIKVRFLRPFPVERIREALKGVKAWASIDRSVVFGWNSGPVFMETRAAVGNADSTCNFSAIGGLGGADISLDDITGCIETLDKLKTEPGKKDTLWFSKPVE
ncbi:phenylglyoxylate dehydrogenase alpha subunit [Lachnospiraceae bacterium PF1-21]|uniref:transketolase C-terminal domain-containing protein n=1 Tax=Ohessyouella blattaphilus TaxID=2949333 RepID=UPI003E28066D